MTKKYRDLTDYLKNHNANTSGSSPTHTRIGDRSLDVYGGSYFIDDEIEAFYEHYYNKVFVKKQNEYFFEYEKKYSIRK